jgi:hypothetical protein
MRNIAPSALLQRVISRMSDAMESALLKLTQIIGVHPTPMIPFAHQQPQPAKAPRKRKSSPAHTDSKVKSRKAQPVLAQTLTEWPFPVLGSQPATPAKSSGKRKPKHSPALPTTVAPLHKLVKQLPADKPPRGKQSATPASKTRQRAKSKAKAK